jgi:DNA-binding NarL/FixJ family response regulator
VGDSGPVVIVMPASFERVVVSEACQSLGLAVAAIGSTSDWAVSAATSCAAGLVLASEWLEDGPVDAVLPRLTRLAPVVVLVDDDDVERSVALLGAGATGCVSWQSGVERFGHSLEAVRAGGVAVPAGALRLVLQQWRDLRRSEAVSGGRSRHVLTPREHEVLVAMADGLATKAIARRLGLNPKTVENHKIRVFEKLGVRNHAHAVHEAITRGLVGGTPVASIAAAAPPPVMNGGPAAS